MTGTSSTVARVEAAMQARLNELVANRKPLVG